MCIKSLVRIRLKICFFLHICWMLEVIRSENSLNFLYWYQTSVCWNISILHYRGTNRLKSRGQVHPLWVILYSATVFVFTSPLYLKGKPFTQDVTWKGYMFRVIYSLMLVSDLIFGKKSQHSQKIDLNRIIRQRLFRFFKFEFFGSIFRILLCGRVYLSKNLVLCSCYVVWGGCG